MRLSVIFDPEPVSWGFRGDPYFWRYLKKRVSRVPLPVSPEKLERFIRSEYYRLSGTKLNSNSIGIVKEFEHGGMTSGGLSGEFWVKYAIPLLKERLVKANEEEAGIE